MRPADNMRKSFRKLHIPTSAGLDEKIRVEIARASVGKNENIPAKPVLWRIIMKSNITKLAAAAVIIVAVVLSISLWDKSLPTAYAIDQTIEAMRNVSTVHCFINTFTGERMELWSKVNPETGENEYFYMDGPDTIVISSPDETYMYKESQNVVIHLKGGGHVVSDIHLGRFIEDMVDAAKSINGKVQIKSLDIDGEKPAILLVIETDEMILESKVDSETKLPMSMIMKPKGDPKPGQIGQSIEDFSFNEPLPEGIFNFEIPEGAQVIEQ